MSEMIWLVYHLIEWLLILLAAWGLGNLFIRKLDCHSEIERITFGLALGLGLCSLLLFFIGVARLLCQQFIWVLTVFGAALTLFFEVRQFKRIERSPHRDKGNQHRRVLKITGISLAFILLAILIASALYPPSQWDGIANHLYLSRQYLSSKRLVAPIGIAQPVLPALNHMLFSWALAIGDDVLAQLLELTFLLLAAAGIWAWGARVGNRLAGTGAAMFWIAQPLVLWAGSSAYVDVSMTTFAFLGCYAFYNFRQSLNAKWWWLSIALWSMAAGTKMPGLFFLAAGMLLGGLIQFSKAYRRHHRTTLPEKQFVDWRSILRSISLALAIAAFISIPWYAFIAYHTGNPFWPMFAGFSRGLYGLPRSIANVQAGQAYQAEPRTLANFLMLSIDWVRFPERFSSERPLFFLIAFWPLAWLISIWDRNVRWWTLWALAFTIFWFFFHQQMRHCLPAVMFAGIALCASVDWLIRKSGASYLTRVACWILIVMLAGGFSSYTLINELKERGIPPTNQEQRDRYLLRLVGYQGAKYINDHPRTGAVCVINGSYLNYYLRASVSDYAAAVKKEGFERPIFKWPEDVQWIRWLGSQDVDYILMNNSTPASLLQLPADREILNSCWPDYELVYKDDNTCVLRRRAA